MDVRDAPEKLSKEGTVNRARAEPRFLRLLRLDLNAISLFRLLPMSTVLRGYSSS